ncbi:MAG: response regulator [Phycisphaerae bacterium]|nr:response regulator [Phycisphaerae bacterium]
MTSREKLSILLVEDNQAHAELLKRTYGNHEMVGRISHVSDGQEALDYLFQCNGSTDSLANPRPDVILLDLRLPKIDGLSVLKEIKESDKLKKIPVVILSSSAEEKDIATSSQYKADNYLVKPLNFSQFPELNDVLGFYWLGRDVFRRQNKPT